MSKKVVSLVLVMTLVLSSMATAFAAPFDLINIKDSSKNYGWDEFVDETDNFDYVGGNLGDYVIESLDGDKYVATEVDNALNAGAESFNDAIEGLTPYVEPQTQYGLVISNADLLSADSVAGELKADGKNIMSVKVEVRDENGVVDQNATGLVVFESLRGLVSANQEAALDKGTASFNVVLPNSQVNLSDTIKVKVKSSSIEGFAGTESAPLQLIYTAFIPGGGGQPGDATYTYTVDSVQSAGVADRVVVYVANVRNDNVDAVKSAILDQVEVGFKKANAPVPVTYKELIKIAKTDILAEGSLTKSYAFTVLVDVSDDIALSDNQNNYYKVNSSTENIRLAQKDEATFMLIDGIRPFIEAVKVSNDNEKYLGSYTILAIFNEAINRTAEIKGNWVLNGHRLTDADVKVIEVLDVEEAGISTPKYLNYDAVVAGKERNSVIIELRTSAALRYLVDGENLIQVKSVSDWAGLTDVSDNNKITTQDFLFNYAKPTTDPGLKLIMQSPEQFVLTLDEPLYLDEEAAVKIDVTSPGAIIVELMLSPLPLDVTQYVEVQYDEDLDQYLLELNEDWTVILDQNYGLDVNTTYHNKDFRVTIQDTYDVYGKRYFNGNVDNRISNKVNIPEDVISPKVDTVEFLGADGTTYKDDEDYYVPTVLVRMTEPVQLVERLYDEELNSLMFPEVTPSMQQQAKDGVPVPTFEFVYVSGTELEKGDTVNGMISTYNIDDAYDYEFEVVTIEDDLPNGEWKLVIRSISDDVGNTMKTEEFFFTVAIEDGEPEPSEDDNIINPYVVWAYADDNHEEDGEVYDLVRILYSRRMSSDALRAATYNINGKQVGQDADITSEFVVLYRQNENVDDENYDEMYDANNQPKWMGQLVTIKLPANFIVGETVEGAYQDADDINGTKHNVLTIPVTLKAVDDENADTVEELLFDNNGGSNQFELRFDGYNYLVTKAGILFAPFVNYPETVLEFLD